VLPHLENGKFENSVIVDSFEAMPPSSVLEEYNLGFIVASKIIFSFLN